MFQGVSKIILSVRTQSGVIANVESWDITPGATTIKFDKPVETLDVADLHTLLEAAQRSRKAYKAAVAAAPDVHTE